jgi:diacylglycerol kinase (ATP)
MRATALLGPGKSSKHLASFQNVPGMQWSCELSCDTEAVVIFGGDGTVHRHLGAVADLNVPMLIVPCGSGNDFARALNLGNVRASLGAWRKYVIDQENVRAIDLGVIRELSAGGAPAPHIHYFCCVAGVGLDTEIARRANALPKWLRAHGGYALSAPREFIRLAPSPMKIETGTPANGFQPTILAAIANASTYGGGMKIAPHARLDDGKLDFCIVRAMDVFKLFCLFPTVYFGRHLGFKEVEYGQAETVRIETERPLDVYADGEFVCRTPVEFGVARNALRVIVPE